ncbi:hypothetical protein SLA2020_407370 [Shorea laevis]
MSMLVNCSNCNTTLQLWPGAQSTRCGICHAITHIAEPRSLQQRPPPPSSNHHHPYGASQSMAPSPYNHAPPGPSPPSTAASGPSSAAFSTRTPRTSSRVPSTTPSA